MIPTCVKCERGMVKMQSGIFLVEMFSDPQTSLPRPYKIWSADLHMCQSCGFKVVASYADNPTFEHHEDGFDEWLETLKRSEGTTIIYQYEELW